MSYSAETLREIYRWYAELKGWSTNSKMVRDSVAAWVKGGIGNVGKAITFYETGNDEYSVDRNARVSLDGLIQSGGAEGLRPYQFFPFLIEKDRAAGTFHFECGECGKILKARRADSGRRGFCRKCTEPLVIPEAKEALASPVDQKAG